VRFEPGNQAAWLALSDRYLSRAENVEAVWALEHGATATEDGVERLKLWLRLARLAREKLHDVAKAEAFEQRADKLKPQMAERAARQSGNARPARSAQDRRGPLRAGRSLRADSALADDVGLARAG